MTLAIALTFGAIGFAVVGAMLGPGLPAGPRPFYKLSAVCAGLAIACAIGAFRAAPAGGPSRRTETLDDSTSASDPGRLHVADRKLRRLRPDLYGVRGLRRRFQERFSDRFPEKTHLAEHLWHGDSRAAVVMQADPLLVAAYTDELDCVAMLRFPAAVAEELRLREGDRLLTVNTYRQGTEIDADLLPGLGHDGRLTGFHLIVAEFVSDDADRIERRKQEISADEWDRTIAMGREYLILRSGVARDGRPGHAAFPADMSASER